MNSLLSNKQKLLEHFLAHGKLTQLAAITLHLGLPVKWRYREPLLHRLVVRFNGINAYA